MIRRPPRSTLSSSSAASDVYKRQVPNTTNKYRRVLLVFTNRSFSQFDEPLGIPCENCPATKFCPSGPVFVNRYYYAQVGQLVISHTDTAVRLLYWQDANRTYSTTLNFLVYEYQAAEEITSLLLRFSPRNTPKGTRVITDTHTPRFLERIFNVHDHSIHASEPGASQLPRETVRQLMEFAEIRFRGELVKSVILAVSTLDRLHLLVSNHEHWYPGADKPFEETWEQFLTPLVPPLQIKGDWMVAVEQDPTLKPRLLVFPEGNSGKPGRQKTPALELEFSTMITCELLFQAFREVRFNESTANSG
eukprot:TRINITY_DN5501_c0_g2_i1.p1 TRINITY_DN5501_c0_g2~~TRINITY_DN5501_c0_g2_i1.p1  ORF type:complete len:305 (-),score=50.67 TRINITY_DN5501_c0_g2_i1:220-1134(-)